MTRRALDGAAQRALWALATLVLSAAAFFAFGVAGVALALVLVVVALGGAQVARGTARRGFWLGLLMPLGLLALFASERMIGAGHSEQWLWRAAASLGIGTSLLWRGYQLARTRGAARKVELRLSLASAGVLAALLLYALSTEAGIAWMGLEGEPADRTAGTLSVLWVALLAISMGALAFMEMAYRGMPVEEAVELRRVDASGVNGLTLALSLIFVASINYVAQERDIKRDLSYFKTTRPSDATIARAQRLGEPLRVVLFYPRVNEVLEQLRPYFDELAAAAEPISVEVQDHALAPELARKHRVRGNGFVVLLRGEGEGQQAESFEVGLELEQARSRLRTLDGRFQQSFAQLTIRPRELYVTTGHRERSASGVDGDPREQRLGELSAALQRSNIASRELGLAQGLANEVPEGARAVAVIGPREPFLPEEAESLLRYVKRGGRLVVFVDPDVDHGLEPLLHGLGVTLREGVLHSERHHIRRGAPPADRAIILANNYSAHPTVTLATRYRRAPAVFDRGGALAKREGAEGVDVTFPLWAGEGYWLDVDGDHAQGEGEPSDSRYAMLAAVTVATEGEEGRAVIIADGDFITDGWIQNAGNAFVLMDTLNWLVGEDHVFGPTQTEEDIEIEHTRDEDKLWFYGTSFAVPLPLLILGFWLARRKLGGRRVSEPRAGRAGEGAAPVRAAAEEARNEPSDAPSSDDEPSHAPPSDAPPSDAPPSDAPPSDAPPSDDEQEGGSR